ncbi:MAG: N-formylglutamate amidohydrolase [Erythrobacter sp.]
MTERQDTASDSRQNNGAAFTLHAPKLPPIPILIAAPHGGRDYPPHVLENMREPVFSQLRLEDRLIDRIASGVATQTGASLLIANAPRAMLDLNRSKSDIDWSMIRGAKRAEPAHSHANRRARSGLGLIPRRLPNFGEIWREKHTQSELDARIDTIHRPYHGALAKEMERIRDHWGAVLLLDLHSMPPLKKHYGLDHIARFVIGDRFGASCDANLSSRALSFLDRQLSPGNHNRPYSGGYVLDQHGAPTRGMHAMQLEVCRSLYLDGALAQLSGGAEPLIEMLAGMVRELAASTARLGDTGSANRGEGGGFAQAAE